MNSTVLYFLVSGYQQPAMYMAPDIYIRTKEELKMLVQTSSIYLSGQTLGEFLSWGHTTH